MARSLSPDEAAVLRADIRLITTDILCPMDPERPDVSAIAIREQMLAQQFDGKTAAELHSQASIVSAALDRERASMHELPVRSTQERAIRAAVEKYFEAAAGETDSYARLFEFWTAERVAFARNVEGQRQHAFSELFGPGSADRFAEREHAPRMSILSLTQDLLRTFRVSRIVASNSKAYVSLRNEAGELRSIFLLQGGQWKAHADVLGYPWSMAGSFPPEACVGVLEK